MTYRDGMLHDICERELSELVTPVEAAKQLGITYCTLNSWRAKGCPHELVSTGLREVARYNLEDVRAWIDSRRSEKKKGN